MVENVRRTTHLQPNTYRMVVPRNFGWPIWGGREKEKNIIRGPCPYTRCSITVGLLISRLGSMGRSLDISFTTLRSESPNKSPEAVRKPAGGYLETATNASRKASQHPPRFSSASSSSSSASFSFSSLTSSFLFFSFFPVFFHLSFSRLTLCIGIVRQRSPRHRDRDRWSYSWGKKNRTTHLLFHGPIRGRFEGELSLLACADLIETALRNDSPRVK